MGQDVTRRISTMAGSRRGRIGVARALFVTLGLALGLTVVTAVPAHAVGIVTVAGSGGSGSNADQLDGPYGVVVDPNNGDVYVSDTYNHRVQKWAPPYTIGTTVAGGNGPGAAANQLDYPRGIALDGSGNLYVADYLNDRVQRFAPGSTSSTDGVTVAGGNGEGSASNQLSGPFGVAVDASGNVFVADTDNSRVQEWSPPDYLDGVTVAGSALGVAGSGDSDLKFPWSVALHGSDLYVADTYNHRIQKFSGSTTGVTVAGVTGEFGSDVSHLDHPFAVTVDSGGNVFVADTDNQRVQEFTPGVTDGVTVAGGNGLGSALDQLAYPRGVAVDSGGNIYVADFGNDRVQAWGGTSTPALETMLLMSAPTTTYEWSGWMSPIKADGSSVFKADSIIKVKFALTGDSASITDLTATLTYGKWTGDESTVVWKAAKGAKGYPGNTFKYQNGLYEFDWATKGIGKGTFMIRVDLGDGVDHAVLLRLK